MARREQVSEADLGAIVVAYLEKIGGDVYQEVEVCGGVADIVARIRAELWIVEVKQTLRLSLITQAMERRRLAHRVFIAAPTTKHSGDVAGLCRELGIGFLEVAAGSYGVKVDDYRIGEPSVRVLAESNRWNSRPVELAKKLQPEHKTHAKAGAENAAGRWTPFRRTYEQLARVVRAEPGIALKDAVGKIQHHYANTRSARTSLVHWVQSGKVEGVRIEGAQLFPTEAR